MLMLWISTALAACIPNEVEVHPPDRAVVPLDSQLWVPQDPCLIQPVIIEVDGGTPFSISTTGGSWVEVGLPELEPGEHEIVVSDGSSLWRKRVRWTVVDEAAPDPVLPDITFQYVRSIRYKRSEYGGNAGYSVDVSAIEDPLALTRTQLLFDGVSGPDTGWIPNSQLEVFAAGSPDEVAGDGAFWGGGWDGTRPLDEACVLITAASVNGSTISEEVCEPAVQEEDGCGCSSTPTMASWGPLSALLLLFGLHRRQR